MIAQNQKQYRIAWIEKGIMFFHWMQKKQIKESFKTKNEQAMKSASVKD